MSGLRYDDYFFAPVKYGIAHYGKSVGSPIVKDTWYPITKMYKEAVIRTVNVTTSADLTGATLKFALRKGINSLVAIPTFLADKSIATAVADTALTFGTMFTTYKPNKFTFGDVIKNTPAITTVDDFNLMELSFQLSGADPTDALIISFTYEFAYQG